MGKFSSFFIGGETFDGREIRKSHVIDRMLTNGDFGQLFSGHMDQINCDFNEKGEENGDL